jgi:hypothetical protein
VNLARYYLLAHRSIRLFWRRIGSPLDLAVERALEDETRVRRRRRILDSAHALAAYQGRGQR